MQSTWQPSNRMLDRYARGHFTYEVEMVLALAVRLNASLQDAVLLNAVLEAMLVHLRLLDDFYGDPKQSRQPGKGVHADDVFARHWLPTWKPRRILTTTERQRAHAQIVHLTARRKMNYKWTGLAQAVIRLCSITKMFTDELERADPHRANAFAQCRASVERYLASPLAAQQRTVQRGR